MSAIVITGVSYTEVKQDSEGYPDPVEINHLPKLTAQFVGDYSEDIPEPMVTRELVYPHAFVDFRTREQRWVGMTKDVQDALELPLEAFRDMSNQIFAQQRELETIKRMGFWKRFKLLFLGKRFWKKG